MTYEVVVNYGNEGVQYVDVENVKEVFFSDDLVFFNNEEGENALIVPKSKLVYAKIVTE